MKSGLSKYPNCPTSGYDCLLNPNVSRQRRAKKPENLETVQTSLQPGSSDNTKDRTAREHQSPSFVGCVVTGKNTDHGMVPVQSARYCFTAISTTVVRVNGSVPPLAF